MAKQCHRTDRGTWECHPRTCTRWQVRDCPEDLIWELYKPAPRKDETENEPAPEHPET